MDKQADLKFRDVTVSRKTSETDIEISLNLDGRGIYRIETGVPFFNHMLEQFSRHSGFDLSLKAVGDTQIDLHHLIEDTGIVLGSALKKASGNKTGIARFSSISVPMDETLVDIACDFSGRAFLVFNFSGKDMLSPLNIPNIAENMRNYADFKDNGFNEILVDKFFYVYTAIFFDALVKNALITLHINIEYGNNVHHLSEAVFKSVGIAVSKSLKIIRAGGIPSTKGAI